MKKIQKNPTTIKIPEFTISSQDPKKINMPLKPIEDKIDHVKKNIKEPEMGCDIVEDIKKDKKISHCLKCVMYLNRKRNC